MLRKDLRREVEQQRKRGNEMREAVVGIKGEGKDRGRERKLARGVK